MEDWTRREFLERTCLIVAAHAGLGALARAPSQKPVEFDKIRLHASSMAELKEFYSRTLDLPVEQAKGVLRVQAGTSVVEFIAGESGASPFYHFAFNIPENKLEAAMDWLRPRCPIFRNPNTGQEIYHFVNWNAHSCYFHDPAGNILEFIARHTLPNASSGKFS